MTAEALTAAAAALVAATAAQEENATKFFDETGRLKGLFGTYPPGLETVVTFGDGTDHADLASLWESIKNKPITGPLRIQFPMGTHIIDHREVIGPHPWASNVRFIGDTANPSNCKIQILNGGGTTEYDINGLEFSGMNGLEISGFEVYGAGVSSNALGIAITNGSKVYMEPDTMVFKDLDLGVFVTRHSHLDASNLLMTGNANGLLADDNGLVNMKYSDITGRGDDTGVGIKAQSGSVIQAYDSDISDFESGAMSAQGGHVGCGSSRISDCWNGHYARAASLNAFGDSGRTDTGSIRCVYGYRADAGGVIHADHARSLNDRTGFFADGGAAIWCQASTITQNDAGAVPAADPNAVYHIRADESSYIRTKTTTWDTNRLAGQEAVAGAGSLIVHA